MKKQSHRASGLLRRTRQLLEYLIEDLAGVVADARYEAIHTLRRRRLRRPQPRKP